MPLSSAAFIYQRSNLINLPKSKSLILILREFGHERPPGHFCFRFLKPTKSEQK